MLRVIFHLEDPSVTKPRLNFLAEAFRHARVYPQHYAATPRPHSCTGVLQLSNSSISSDQRTFLQKVLMQTVVSFYSGFGAVGSSLLNNLSGYVYTELFHKVKHFAVLLGLLFLSNYVPL